MKKTFLLFFRYSIFMLVMLASTTTIAQYNNPKKVPTDAELLALCNKYVTTPIYKTVKPNGDVFLQRNMSPYLHATLIKANDPPPSNRDFGHDHKDAMLEAFLNRPHPSVATLTKYFTDAATEFNVPVSLLMATAQVQSNWAQVSESMYGSWGVMGVIENNYIHQITDAAQMLQVSSDQIKNDAQTNIRAAAALLAHYQSSLPPANTLIDWFAALKELTGLTDEKMKAELATRIFQVINEGSKTVSLWKEIININAFTINVPEEATSQRGSSTARIESVDYPLAIENYTTCNYGTRPAGYVIKYYFVHYVGTGTYQGAISWFKDCSSDVSAHYVIRNSDGQISQVVAEVNRAFSQGVTEYNNNGIGVEHEVIATNLSMWDSEPMLVAAGKLCANVCDRRTIPKVRRAVNLDWGIYGHSDVRSTDCPNMTQARWDTFMVRVRAAQATVSAPVLYSVANSGSGSEITATWKANTEPTLSGYRLYYANNDALSSWSLAADENTLTATTTSVTLNASQFSVVPAGNVYHFKLVAVIPDGANPRIESGPSDIYSRSSNVSGQKVLIVDGFDRSNGSYTLPYHSFSTSYFKALRDRGALQVSTVANEKVEDGTFSLSDYNIVVWFVGDESSANVVLSAAEKTAISNYLAGGGKLLLSGSEIAYNIGRSAAATYDLTFMTNYLKSSYVGDGLATYTPATGVAGTDFAGLNIPFGIVYPEDFPDDINALGGSVNILTYAVGSKKAGVAFKGIFGPGTVPGGLIYLSFTLETATDISMSAFMEKALLYFSTPPVPVAPTTVADAASVTANTAKRINVLSNDLINGFPINPTTVSIFVAPLHGTATAEANGDITYVPASGYTGTDNFQYKVLNTSGLLSNAATVTITVVAAVNNCNATALEVDDAYPKKDLRGAWVSSVSNIDWPSSRTLTTAQQQAELIRILDTLNSTGINTVFLQVRPECDALYPSALDPWSYWLTNAQGTAPNPLWDPLQFAVEQAHARGMDIHAWLNPYRAKQSTPTLAPNHVAVLHPDWTFVSGTLTQLNPGLPQVRSYLTNVVADIATRYDVDGIHFDDYFYPYTPLMASQDTSTYRLYNPTNIATIADWRRNNVNQLIASIYDTLQKININSQKNVVFGVSPFGIWKSGTPAGIVGMSSYSDIYCDPIAWLQAGKVDYIAPQLYWKITGAQDYLSLSKWWNDQAATYGKHLYPGLALYRLTDGTTTYEPDEIQAQINVNRSSTHMQVLGQVLFSTKQIMTNAKNIKPILQANQYKYKSFAPPMTWKDIVCPNAPTNIRVDVDSLKWDAPPAASDGDISTKFVVYRFDNATDALILKNDGKKIYAITTSTKITIPASEPRSSVFVVTALDKNNNESEATISISLPLSGLVMDVLLNGSVAFINWNTQTERNTKVFEIEESIDGKNFSFLGSVAASGNSNGVKKYTFQDRLLQEGLNFYRIKITDLDGSVRYSPIKSVLYHTGKNNIVVAPNPFVETINVTNLIKAERIDLMDMSGRVLYSRNVKNITGLSIPTGVFPAGMYHLKITQLDGTTSVVKIIKQQ